jgi:hypothetical protein
MSIGFIGLFVYYRSIGGYSVISLDDAGSATDSPPSEASGGAADDAGEPAAEGEIADGGGDEPAAE